MKSKINAAKDREKFWAISKEYISHHLPDLQKASPNTVEAYRTGLNKFIDYLEEYKDIRREDLTFEVFSRNNIKAYLDWMLNERKYAEKTCNLRLTAIHSLLEYAGFEENIELMPIYIASCSGSGIKVKNKPIEYFEKHQMKALLNAPDINSKIGRRNQMMLILYYDTGARNSEIIETTCEQLHLNTEVPYITILGKGRKYRNIPLINKTVELPKSILHHFLMLVIIKLRLHYESRMVINQ